MDESTDGSRDVAQCGINLPDADLARKTLREVCADMSAPAAARAQAASKLAEIAGIAGRYQESPKDVETRDLSTMSLQELDREIRRLRVNN